MTFAFGKNYAFRRTIVSVDEKGNINYTPTDNYGGNNGRSALLGSNGLYYMVGNANNGNAKAFGPANGTNPDVTETTGLEVVTPVGSSVVNPTIASATSAEVDPMLQFTIGGKLDKAGKDDNFRGITEFGGALFFTKGSGGNGMQTVYTASRRICQPLPTQSPLPLRSCQVFRLILRRPVGISRPSPYSSRIRRRCMSPTRAAGTRRTQIRMRGYRSGLLGSDGSWHLQYVLTKGLIGVVDSNVTGSDGPWPAITTVGLRNLTGRIDRDGTVTLWATTSTSSASGDNGADPNKVVEITDRIAATQLSQVGNESFTTVAGPVYRTVFRGVGFVE